jgi:starvation-inducible outer membrane lipoprotein
MKKLIFAALVLAGCESAYTAEGCPIYASEMMQAKTQACIAEYHAEKARLEGRVVTTCRTVGSTTTCVEG